MTFNLPVLVLGDTHESDVVDVTIKRDPEGTKVTKERITSLIEKLKQKKIS